jgi:hypothetical protein
MSAFWYIANQNRLNLTPKLALGFVLRPGFILVLKREAGLRKDNH